MKKLHIAIDFDSTIASERFPKVGVLINRAKTYINLWHIMGHTIVINTCRSGKAEEDAIEFLNKNNIHYDFINENDPKLIEYYGLDCRKIGADIYIDDKSSDGYVDWDKEWNKVDMLANQKPLIICIVGKSGSGKTTLAEHIEREFGIVMIQSHTDRDKRTPDEDGHTFHTPEEFNKFNHEDMLAYVKFGDKQYCCLKSDLRRKNTYVIDESGLSQLDRSEYDVISIRTNCSKKTLEKRVGAERAARDKGKFSFFHPFILWFSKFNYYVNTNCSKEKSQIQINKVIKKILKNRPYA